MVKGRIETRHLHQIGKPVMKCLCQQDLFRQLLDHFRCDPLWFAVFRSAMHHAMSHCRQLSAPDAVLDPIHQQPNCHRVIRGSY
jgi:hypothetical protein